MTIEVANNLVDLRKKAGLSQEQLASQLGISRQSVSKWERAEASPDMDNLIALSGIYNISLDELLLIRKSQPKDIDTSILKEETTEVFEAVPIDDEQDAEFEQSDYTGESSSESQQMDRKEYVNIGLGGIHIEDGESSVHIGSKGIFVQDSEEEVHVGWGGVKVKNRSSAEQENESSEYSVYQKLKRFPFPIICLVLFLLFGFLGGWATSWLIFLTIPLYYTAIEALEKKNANYFAYPVLMVILFFALGFFNNQWGYSWIVFLTIPIYYWIGDFVKKN